MPLLFLIGSLLVLWAFIVWDRKKPLRPLTRERMRRGWSLSMPVRWPMWLGLSFVSATLSLNYWFTPPTPPFTGRGSSLYRLLYEQWGGYGIAAAWSMAALGFLAVALVDLQSHRRARKK